MSKRTVNWTPKCFTKTIDGASVELYKGHLLIEIPMASDRMRELIKHQNLQREDAVSDQEAMNAMLDLWDRQSGLLKMGEVVRVSDGAKVELEDLFYDQQLTALPLEFAAKYLAGFGPGN